MSISLAKLVHELLARVAVRIVSIRFEILLSICEKLLAEPSYGHGTVNVGKEGLLREKNFKLLLGLPFVPLSFGKRFINGGQKT